MTYFRDMSYFDKQCRKKLKGNPLGFFNIHSVAKHQKLTRDPLRNFFRKKVSQCRKKLKGGLFSLSRYGMLRGKR